MERISWHHYFMAQSHLLALRSTCERLSVGATIVRDKRIIAGGYNGSIAGDDHCIETGCYVVENHCIRTIHAEMNAIIQCAKFGVPTEGAEIYVTHFPCLQCAKAIIQAGIKKVYYARDYKNHPFALTLFEKAKIELEKVESGNVIFEQEAQKKKEFVHELIDKLDSSGLTVKEKEELEKKVSELFK